MIATEAEVEGFLHMLSEREGRSTPAVTWVDGGGSQVRPGRRNHLELDRRILSDRADARFTAAHEFGHIVLGHTSARRLAALIALYVGTLVAVMVVATWLLYAPTGAFWLLPVGFVVGGVAWLPIQRQLSLRLKQPMEHAADLFAARVGGPLTKDLVARYEAERTGTGRLLSYVFPLHPSWAERLEVTRSRLSSDSRSELEI